MRPGYVRGLRKLVWCYCLLYPPPSCACRAALVCSYCASPPCLLVRAQRTSARPGSHQTADPRTKCGRSTYTAQSSQHCLSLCPPCWLRRRTVQELKACGARAWRRSQEMTDALMPRTDDTCSASGAREPWCVCVMLWRLVLARCECEVKWAYVAHRGPGGSSCTAKAYGT